MSPQLIPKEPTKARQYVKNKKTHKKRTAIYNRIGTNHHKSLSLYDYPEPRWVKAKAPLVEGIYPYYIVTP